jgi:MFS family permease
MEPARITTFGKWMALTAALLGWLFDGLEMGLFPLVARPALRELLANGSSSAELDTQVTTWLGIITALFLVGAATGGVLFGWLGDRFGRVRAMMLSVLTYAIVSGLCGFATSAWQIGALRFVASLGMGGEWSLGVALINEIWPDRSRAFLAGLIGAAGNVGYLLIALIGLGLSQFVQETRSALLAIGISEEFVGKILANDGWRFLMMICAAPALLTFLIRLYVPESARWEHERDKGTTSHWAKSDLWGVLIGAVAACFMISLWTPDFPQFFKDKWTGFGLAELDEAAMSRVLLGVRVGGSVLAFLIVLGGYVFPVMRFLRRSEADGLPEYHRSGPTLKRMLLGAALSGVALVGTWGSVQQIPYFTGALIDKTETARWESENGGPPTAEARSRFGKLAREGTSRAQSWAAVGAIIGTILAALLANRFGRRISYILLCAGSLAVIPGFFLTRTSVDGTYLFLVCLVGGITASFYGWLPLYLPEIFRTSVRATGQGFSFNFGRILAAIGSLQLGSLTALFGGLHYACASLSAVYIIGMGLIWLVPETKGQPLPE